MAQDKDQQWLTGLGAGRYPVWLMSFVCVVVGVRARREGRTGRSREEGGEAEEPALSRKAGVSPRYWGWD